MRNVLFCLVGVGMSALISAQEGVRSPGTFKPTAQISAELESSTPELGIVAGQRTEVVAALSSCGVDRRALTMPVFTMT